MKKKQKREFGFLVWGFDCGLVKHLNPEGSVGKDHASFPERSSAETAHNQINTKREFPDSRLKFVFLND
ncbi:MAG: hypothetical protein WC924_03235 [Candidatus Gracilibacteria bacterium]